MDKNKLLRKDIINSIYNALEPLDYVFGMWQCGSAAFKRIDDWSDIDVVVDVDDDKFDELFKVIDNTLEKLSPIENVIGSPQSLSQGAFQKVYKLKDTSKFMVIEVCAIKHSSDEKLLAREIHGDILVHFDKKNITDVKPIDKNEFAKQLTTRLEKLDGFFNMYQFLVEKELNRNNNIEAMAFFHGVSLNPMIEILRIKYKPFRYTFRTRYVYYDLPSDVVKRLESFYFIKDSDELKTKHIELIKWFNETKDELKDLDLKELL